MEGISSDMPSIAKQFYSPVLSALFFLIIFNEQPLLFESLQLYWKETALIPLHCHPDRHF